MALAAEKSMSELEQKYNEVAELFSIAEELASTVDNTFIRDPKSQMNLVEPLINTIAESADILTEEYIALLEGSKQPSSKTRIESAMRKIYVAMHEYSARAGRVTQNAVGNIRNLADPIVEKLKRQMETIVANFMEFVKLSLDRVMQKHDIEELKERHERIALMLHAQTLGQGAN